MQFPCKKSDDAIGEKRLVFQNPTSAPEKSETVEAEPAANKALEDMTVRELMWKLENDAERTAGLEKQLLDKLEIDTTLEDFYRSHTEAIAPKAEVSIPQGEEKGIGEKAAGVLDQVTEWTRGTMDDVMGYSKTMSPKEKAMEHKKRLVERIRSIKQEERGVTLEDLDNVQKRIETEAAGLVKGGPKFTKENAQFTLIAGAAVGGLLLYRWFTSGSLWESMKSTAWTTAKVGAGFAGVGLAAEAIHRIAGDTEIGKYAAKVSSWYERSVPGLTQYQQAEAAERSMDLRDPGIEYAVEYQNLISLLRDYKSGKSTIYMSSYEKEAEINGQAEIKVQILRTIDRMEKTEPKSSKLVQEQLDAIKTELQSPSPSQDLLDGIVKKLEEVSLNEAFANEVPPEIHDIITERWFLEQQITNDQLPAGANNRENPIRAVVENRTEKTLTRLDYMKKVQTDVLGRFGRTLTFLVTREVEVKDEHAKLKALEADTTMSATDKEALQARLAGLNLVLDNCKAFSQNYTDMLGKQQGTAELINDLENDFTASKNTFLKEGTGKKQALNTLYDKHMGMEVIFHQSLKIPKELLYPDLFDQLMVGGLATMAAYQLIGLGGILSIGTSAVVLPWKILKGFDNLMTNPSQGRISAFLDKYGGPGVAKGAIGLGIGVYFGYRAASVALQDYKMLSNRPRETSTESIGYRFASLGINVTGGALELWRGTRMATAMATTKGPFELTGKAIWHVAIMAAIDEARVRGAKWADNASILADLKDLPTDKVPVDKLMHLLPLYADRNERGALTWATEEILGPIAAQDNDLGKALREYVVGDPNNRENEPEKNVRKEMRVKIMKSIGQQEMELRGFTEPEIIKGLEIMIRAYNSFTGGKEGYPFDRLVAAEGEEDSHLDILNNAIVLAEVCVETQKRKEAKDSTLTNGTYENQLHTMAYAASETLEYTKIKPLLGNALKKMADAAQLYQFQKQEAADATLDPEIRYFFNSLGKYDEIVKFYLLCSQAAKEEKDPIIKGRLDEYIKQSAAYVHFITGGYGGMPEGEALAKLKTDLKVEDGATISLEQINDYIHQKQKENISDPEKGKRNIIHYYLERAMSTVLENQMNQNPRKLEQAEKSALLVQLAKDYGSLDIGAAGFTNGKEADFIKSFNLPSGTTLDDLLFSGLFFKGTNDGKLHRIQKEKTPPGSYGEEIFVGGRWYDTARTITKKNGDGFDFIPTEPVNWVQNSYYYETKIDGLRYVYIAKYNRFLVDTGSPALPPSIDAFSVSVKNGKMEKPEQDLNDYASISLYELPEKVYDGFVKYLKQKETPAASPAA